MRLQCSICDRTQSTIQPIYETPWDGVYWCGNPNCALELMRQMCEEVPFDENDND